MRKLLFVDRDGTILEEPADQQIDSLEKVKFVSGAIPALKALQEAGWRLILVSNQDGLGSVSFPEDDFLKPQRMMIQVLESCGVTFEAIHICPHRVEDDCRCRKPKLGLLQNELKEGFDREQSAVVGDRASDMQLAEALFIRGFQLSEKLDWGEVVRALIGHERRAEVNRKTRETHIHVAVNLDHFEAPQIQSGSKFLDHMLEQIAQHAGISLNLEASGDWGVDDHHTVEDTALALGQALREALGDKHGITRYGFLLPMDEALAECALDLSGRPHCSYDVCYTREFVGGVATEMFPHFFHSLADGLRASLHLKIAGVNNHHLAEAGFKAFGRCLGQAITRGRLGHIPSSKGAL